MAEGIIVYDEFDGPMTRNIGGGCLSFAETELLQYSLLQIQALIPIELHLFVLRAQHLLMKEKQLQRTCSPESSLNHFRSLSGPDFLKMSPEKIEALSLDALRNLALRSQRLLATATFPFDIHSFFDLVPDVLKLSILLEFLDIEELSRFDRALNNNGCRKKFLDILRYTEHRGLLSMSRNYYDFDSGIAEWLESRNIFMRALNFEGFIDRNAINNHIPAGFLARTGEQLREISLDANLHLQDACLEDLLTVERRNSSKRFSRLEALDLSGCRGITDDGATSLAQSCPGLLKLRISDTKVTNIGLIFIAFGCKYLKFIDLDGLANISDTGLLVLAMGCTMIEILVLNGCDITDRGASYLARFCRLHTLYFRCEKITENGLALLDGCKALRKIDLQSSQISNDGLNQLTMGCPGLEDVDLSHCWRITDEGASSLAQLCTLHTLDISFTAVTDFGLIRLGGEEGCKALKKIGLQKLEISDAGLDKFAKLCPGLECLNLAKCKNINDDGVSSLARCCPGLLSLDISFTAVTDIGLGRLGEGCRALKTLKLSSSKFFSDTGLRKIAEGCPRLEDVRVDECPSITDTGVTSLVQLCPRLHTLDHQGTQVTEECIARLEAARNTVKCSLYRTICPY